MYIEPESFSATEFKDNIFILPNMNDGVKYNDPRNMEHKLSIDDVVESLICHITNVKG